MLQLRIAYRQEDKDFNGMQFTTLFAQQKNHLCHEMKSCKSPFSEERVTSDNESKQQTIIAIGQKGVNSLFDLRDWPSQSRLMYKETPRKGAVGRITISASVPSWRWSGTAPLLSWNRSSTRYPTTARPSSLPVETFK